MYANFHKTMKRLATAFILSGLMGCGATGPFLHHTSGDLIHLGEKNIDTLSCGYDMATYVLQAELTCRKFGFKTAKIRTTYKSKNKSCSDKITEATFKCEDIAGQPPPVRAGFERS
jgi:hypothetical protein